MIAQRFLFAGAVNGIALFVLGALHVPLTFLTFLLVLIASIWSAAAMPPLSVTPKAAAWLPHSILALVLLILATITPLTDYDGVATWIPKAKAIAREASITGPFFRGERGLNLHNHYPLLIPLNDAAIMRLTGTIDDRAVRWLYVLIPLAALLAISEGRAWICFGIVLLPQVIAAPEGGVLSAYNDLAVAAFFGMAVYALDRSEFAGVWLAALILTKNEGIALAIASIIAAAIARKLRVRDLWLPAVAFIALIAWRAQIPDAYDERYSVLVRELPSHANRFFYAVVALLRAAIDLKTWGLFWPAVLVAMLIARKRALLPSVAIAIAFASYAIAFTVTSWSIDELAKVAANRLLVQLVIASVACFGVRRPQETVSKGGTDTLVCAPRAG